MDIVLACDDNYVPYLGVAVMSVCENVSSARFHVLDGGISDKNKKKLLNISPNMQFYSVDVALFAGFTTGRDYISLSTFHRFLIPSLLSTNITKCLYLDCDVLVMADFFDFYNIDFDGYYFAVVADECGLYQRKRLGLGTADYFNAGVMLFNLEELRKFDFAKVCIDFYIANKERLPFDDQDVLNSLFSDRCKYVHLRYNAHSRVFVDTDEALSSSSMREIEEAAKKPAIVHFTGDLKPWDTMCTHPLKKEYQLYLAKSSWNNALLHDGYWKYLLYKVLSKLTFGELRRHCENRRNILHGKVRRVRQSRRP